MSADTTTLIIALLVIIALRQKRERTHCNMILVFGIFLGDKTLGYPVGSILGLVFGLVGMAIYFVVKEKIAVKKAAKVGP